TRAAVVCPSPPTPVGVDDGGIEPRSTASSERRLPSRPVVGSAAADGPSTITGRERRADRSHALARTLRSSCGRDSGRLQEGFRLAHKDGASPGNRTLLVGVTARGLATSLATQSRREESNPVHHGRNVALSTELRREDALDGN